MHQQALNIISFLFLRNSYDGLRRCQRADSGIVETIQARVGYPSFKCTRYTRNQKSPNRATVAVRGRCYAGEFVRVVGSVLVRIAERGQKAKGKSQRAFGKLVLQ